MWTTRVRYNVDDRQGALLGCEATGELVKPGVTDDDQVSNFLGQIAGRLQLL